MGVCRNETNTAYTPKAWYFEIQSVRYLSEHSFLEKRTKSIVTLYLRKAYITKICGDMNVRTLRLFK